MHARLRWLRWWWWSLELFVPTPSSSCAEYSFVLGRAELLLLLEMVVVLGWLVGSRLVLGMLIGVVVVNWPKSSDEKAKQKRLFCFVSLPPFAFAHWGLPSFLARTLLLALFPTYERSPSSRTRPGAQSSSVQWLLMMVSDCCLLYEYCILVWRIE